MSQPPPPSWAPAWTPVAPPAPAAPAGPVGAPARPAGRLLLAAGVGLLAGLLGSGLVVAGLFAVAADDLGGSLGDRIGSAVEKAIVEGTRQATEDSLEDFGAYPEGDYSAHLEDIEQFPPVPPEGLGSIPLLDSYAQDCFGGALQACDDLLYESPPLSAYEEYATTCGGRVKAYSVGYCPDLD